MSDYDLRIKRARNGWVLTMPPEMEDGLERVEVIEEHEDLRDPPEGVNLLWAIIEELGLDSNAYDARRLYVGWKPGEKHHDVHPQPCDECECKCDPDQSTPDE